MVGSLCNSGPTMTFAQISVKQLGEVATVV